jgi:integrase/recombinase XerD
LAREAYELDLRQFVSWCHDHHLRLFQARRTDIECFARDLEARGRARATVTRRLCGRTRRSWYSVEEELLDHSPAVHSGVPAWTTSRMPLGWIATRSARCLSRLGGAGGGDG